MIKSLFGEDENDEKKEEKSPNNIGGLGILSDDQPKKDSEEKVSTPDFETEKEVKQVERIETVDEIKAAIENPPESAKEENNPNQVVETVKPFEVEHPIGQPTQENIIETNQPAIKHNPVFEEPLESARTVELENKLREIEEELKKEKELEEERRKRKKEEERRREIQNAQIKQVQPLNETETLVSSKQANPQQPLWNDWDKDDQEKEENKVQITPKAFDPNEQAKDIRNMGMAWSAAIALFGAVVVMLLIGWIVDTLLGSSPWGIVIGVVIGAIIGFLQFFRTTSQIVNPKPSDFEKVSLNSNIKVAEESKEDKKESEKSEESSEVKPDETIDEKSEESNDEKTEEKSENEDIDKNEIKSLEKPEEILDEMKLKESTQETVENAEITGEDIIETIEKTVDEENF